MWHSMIMMLSWLNKSFIYKDRQQFINQIRFPTEAVSETLSPKNNINDCRLLPEKKPICSIESKFIQAGTNCRTSEKKCEFPYGLERRTLSGVNMPCTQPSDESQSISYWGMRLVMMIWNELESKIGVIEKTATKRIEQDWNINSLSIKHY